MNLKIKFCFLIGCMLFSTSALAQKRNVYYLNNDGIIVKQKDADFMRIIQEPDSTSIYYKVLEFYPDNTRKFLGHVSSFNEKLTLEGLNISFDKSGKKSSQISYVNGWPTGMAFYFYPDGTVQKAINFTSVKGMNLSDTSLSGYYEMVDYFDPSGVQTVKNGNGYAIIQEGANFIREEGRYRQGLKDSIWQGSYQESGRFYEELYRNGILISGVQTLPDGTKLPYTKLQEPAQYKGGEKLFYQFLAKNFKYPQDARESGISGKFDLKIIVKADGTPSFVSAYPVLTHSIEEAAIDLVLRSPKWITGKLRGKPVAVSYVIPISLNLSSSHQGGFPQSKKSNF